MQSHKGSVLQILIDLTGVSSTGYCDLASIEMAMPAGLGMNQDDILGTLRDLKSEGKIDFPDRGRNARSRYTLVKPGPVFEPEPSPVSEPEPPQAQETKPANVGMVTFIVPDIEALSPDEGYYGDAYLARIAADSTPCYGGWSPRASTCTRCHLRNECRQAAIAELLTMQARFVVTNAEPVTHVTESKPVNQAVPTTLAPFTVVCVKCEQAIKAGDPIVSSVDMGVFHPHCAVHAP
jgi:hypothetical protein